ncbi:MAG: 2-amino-4-hydroxy-6-hydroxymethyldihydropteridine diphosphokinase [Lachnospiraceae bacterium]|nr:2-amino-4-hydroxy-6-hydroxymethyldihydropteridine diphosphokinase [Lachnospiraceae bacterium]
MDRIKIDGLQVFAHHGVYDFETKKGQNFYINAELFCDTRKAGKSDELSDSTNYGEVCEFIKDFMEKNTYKLLEAVAENLSKAILLKYDLIKYIKLEICKPEAPIQIPFKNVSVEVKRGWTTVFLSGGSNMGDSVNTLNGAIEMLKEDPDIKNVTPSKFIITKPYGGVEQDDFVNCAIMLETILDPETLLDRLHEIESFYKRERKVHWGPRTLDLDIVFFGKTVYESDRLIIPHVDMQNRAFVLEPLAELAPNFRHPILGKTVEEMLNSL